ncbi:MAG: glutamine synthetase adenylyltransferase, partial [Chloroflexi bacterium]|nr:glutamine synthetase adenylyltransferase [Chloroflexota bacterium]
NALTMLNVNIERAEVRTEGDEVRDTFWLTDSSGYKITDERRLNELRVAAALIKQFTRLLPRSPNPAQALRQFNALTQQILASPDWMDRLRDLESAPVLQTLAEMMGVSQFLWEDFLRMQHENLFPVLLDVPALDERKSRDALYRDLHERTRDAADHERRVQALNSFKDREMFRVDLRHITNRIGFREFAQELSDLAEVVVDEAAKLSQKTLAPRYGSPALDGGRPCPWAICALGKFGGRELGFGSDIELLFVYEGEGKTDGAESIQNSLYFGNFVRAFLSVLKAKREGIFEIDLRLRPYGDKGAMASALDEFRRYYSPDGFARQFERMALVKLRPVAGDPAFGKKVVQARDAFVYSGAPLDIENILHLRRRQAAELVRPGAVNAKYSPGGLVDLEYYVQAWQIATGHSDPDKSGRVTNTLDAIERLVEGRHMSRKLSENLRRFYAFLRRLIDALRAVRGHAKDLTIPPTDSREFAYLTHRLQFRSPAELQDAIASCMDAASKVWEYGVAESYSA